MAEEIPPKQQIATQEEMMKARVPLGYRDQCAHLLIPLNECRVKEFYLPWKCEHDRHTYEKCEYELFMERVRKMQKIRKEAKLLGRDPMELLAERAAT
ncbi:hypothetical protein SUGI_1119820 [Cryptomeria japonica]|uniref:NADH dehydrogenase [ubiquinone] 1 beta subcomplex subunit 7 n=1 Tax=Cryptomeria japonica TaxID=3369 RepID=UPI0024146B72|nr:NADH dehydrogenase [ubiquinone] 1 beta subcomplex subunit 7 [Cryptomeria japonica]XP_059069878.1 NADH dehydrogenase [ubiquinone] 1 beta subcomplex subunit 7 [Cryptomeria japonica]GLJ52617.1 hypothetical protein SUGI_1119820 [Cryptomeria japonica]